MGADVEIRFVVNTKAKWGMYGLPPVASIAVLGGLAGTLGINLAKVMFEQCYKIWVNGEDSNSKVCDSISLAASLFHELQHICRASNDEGIFAPESDCGACYRAEMAGCLMQYALLHRYSFVKDSTCCEGFFKKEVSSGHYDTQLNWLFGKGDGTAVPSTQCVDDTCEIPGLENLQIEDIPGGFPAT